MSVRYCLVQVAASVARHNLCNNAAQFIIQGSSPSNTKGSVTWLQLVHVDNYFAETSISRSEIDQAVIIRGMQLGYVD
ncbi:hypothetical protein V7S43_010264, partial [Phytophthora oleae]